LEGPAIINPRRCNRQNGLIHKVIDDDDDDDDTFGGQNAELVNVTACSAYRYH
jgi:hypothetical protein